MTGALLLLTIGIIIFIIGYNGTGQNLLHSLSQKSTSATSSQPIFTQSQG